MRSLIVLLCLTITLKGEILDRMAITVDRQVITESQLTEELRVTAFLNHRQPDETRDARRAAAERLIEQELIRREMRLSQYPSPAPADVDALWKATQNDYGGPGPIRKKLEAYGLDERILKDHLGFQLMTLKFIEFRFRPDVSVSDQDISDYYSKHVANWSQSHKSPPPSLKESRTGIEKTLSDQRAEYALSSWIEETRKDVDIIYLDKDLD